MGILKKIEPKLPTMFSQSPKTPFEIRRTEKFRKQVQVQNTNRVLQMEADQGIFTHQFQMLLNINVTNGFESLFLHEAIPGHHYQVSLQQEKYGNS